MAGGVLGVSPNLTKGRGKAARPESRGGANARRSCVQVQARFMAVWVSKISLTAFGGAGVRLEMLYVRLLMGILGVASSE